MPRAARDGAQGKAGQALGGRPKYRVGRDDQGIHIDRIGRVRELHESLICCCSVAWVAVD